MPRFNDRRYALVGYVVTKVVLPIAKRRMKRKARHAAGAAVHKPAQVAREHPATTGVAVGSLLGAAAYVVRQRLARRHEDDE